MTKDELRIWSKFKYGPTLKEAITPNHTAARAFSSPHLHVHKAVGIRMTSQANNGSVHVAVECGMPWPQLTGQQWAGVTAFLLGLVQTQAHL